MNGERVVFKYPFGEEDPMIPHFWECTLIAPDRCLKETMVDYVGKYGINFVDMARYMFTTAWLHDASITPFQLCSVCQEAILDIPHVHKLIPINKEQAGVLLREGFAVWAKVSFCTRPQENHPAANRIIYHQMKKGN